MLQYQAYDTAGNSQSLHSTSFRYDDVAPVTTTTVLPTYSTVATLTLSISDNFSGVSATKWRVDGSSWTTGTVATVTYAPGTHAVDFYSTDRAGNDEAIKSVNVDMTGRVEQTDSHLLYFGTWATNANAARSSGSWTSCNTSGAVVYAQFNGTGVDWIASVAPTYGKGLVSVDGTSVATVDLYSSGYTHQKKVWSVRGLANGTHQVKIAWLGSMNASSTGTAIGVDAFDIVGVPVQTMLRTEQDDSNIAYDGTWTTNSNVARSSGTWAAGNTTGSVAYIDFDGTALDLIGSTAPSYGIAQLTVDGTVTAQADFYSASYLHQRKVWGISGLSAGQHEIAIAWTGTKNPLSSGTAIGIDALDISGGLTKALTPSQRMTRFEQTNARIAYDGTWATMTNSARSGGSWAAASTAGAIAYVNFTGTAVKLIGSTAPSYGRAKITLDGTQVSTADFYSAGFAHQVAVWSATGLTDGAHTIVIEYAGDKNAASTGTAIGIDAIDLLGTLTQAVVPTPAETVYDQTDVHFVYTGLWSTLPNSLRFGGSWATINATGSVGTTFTGTDADLYASIAPSYGIATVTLDDVTSDVDLYSAGYAHQAHIWKARKLTNTTHTLKIEWTGRRNASSTGTAIGIDALGVAGSLVP